MSTTFLISTVIILIGVVTLFSKKYARWGSLVAAAGFVPLGWYYYQQHGSLFFLILGLAIVGVAGYRFFRPYKKQG